MFSRRVVVVALSIPALAMATPAVAHAQLQQAVPAVGGTVSASPQDLRLRFSEGIEPRFSTVTLATEAGTPIPLGRPTVDPAERSSLVVKVGQKLQPGTYAVTWHVVSVDTHKTQGSFNFTVSP